MTIADGDESASYLPTQLASSGSMDLIENEFQFLKDYDSSGWYRDYTITGSLMSSRDLLTILQSLVEAVSLMFPQQSSMKNQQKSIRQNTKQLHSILEPFLSLKKRNQQIWTVQKV